MVVRIKFVCVCYSKSNFHKKSNGSVWFMLSDQIGLSYRSSSRRTAAICVTYIKGSVQPASVISIICS